MSFKYFWKYNETVPVEKEVPLDLVRSHLCNSYVDPETILCEAQFRTELTGQPATVAIRGGAIVVQVVHDFDPNQEINDNYVQTEIEAIRKNEQASKSEGIPGNNIPES